MENYEFLNILDLIKFHVNYLNNHNELKLMIKNDSLLNKYYENYIKEKENIKINDDL